MARIRIEQLHRLIELLGDEIDLRLEKPVLLRELLLKIARGREDVREALFQGDRLNPDIFIVRGDVCISLKGGMDETVIEDSDEISLHQVGAGG